MNIKSARLHKMKKMAKKQNDQDKLLDCQGFRDQKPSGLRSIQTVAKDWKMVRVLSQPSFEI